MGTKPKTRAYTRPKRVVPNKRKYTPVDQGTWDLDDAVLFPLIVLEIGAPPEKGWKFSSDEETQPNVWGKAYTRDYKPVLEAALLEHYTPPLAYRGRAKKKIDKAMEYRYGLTYVGYQIARKRNQFLKWVWRERQRQELQKKTPLPVQPAPLPPKSSGEQPT